MRAWRCFGGGAKMDAIAIAIAHSSSAETDAAKKRRARPS